MQVWVRVLVQGVVAVVEAKKRISKCAFEQLPHHLMVRNAPHIFEREVAHASEMAPNAQIMRGCNRDSRLAHAMRAADGSHRMR